MKLIRWLYHKLTSKIDKEVVNDLGEYFNLNQKEIKWLLKSGGRLNADFWYILKPKTKEEIKNFYQTTPFNIFELIYWHSKRTQRLFRSEVIETAKGKVLDYGGGVGDLSISLFKKGFEIHYAELGGNTFDFAEWMFKKRGCNIKTIDSDKDKISEKYNTIICIDVIEHIVDSKELLNNLVSRLEDRGKLIITNLNAPVLKNHPMHIRMNFNGEEYLNSLGLVKDKKSWLWIKK